MIELFQEFCTLEKLRTGVQRKREETKTRKQVWTGRSAVSCPSCFRISVHYDEFILTCSAHSSGNTEMCHTPIHLQWIPGQSRFPHTTKAYASSLENILPCLVAGHRLALPPNLTAFPPFSKLCLFLTQPTCTLKAGSEYYTIVLQSLKNNLFKCFAMRSPYGAHFEYGNRVAVPVTLLFSCQSDALAHFLRKGR